jgi:FixJ family two-component response regulator
MSDVTPVAFVVDDGVSARESMESLTRCGRWHPATFISAEEIFNYYHFLSHTSIETSVAADAHGRRTP